MAEAVKEAVEGVKNLAVSGEPKQKKEKKKKGAPEGADGRPQELSPQPAYFDHRIQILWVEHSRHG
jgi:threonyl-tRNA synthetase